MQFKPTLNQLIYLTFFMAFLTYVIYYLINQLFNLPYLNYQVILGDQYIFYIIFAFFMLVGFCTTLVMSGIVTTVYYYERIQKRGVPIEKGNPRNPGNQEERISTR